MKKAHSPVPEILFQGPPISQRLTLWSTAELPKHETDSCACWQAAARRAVKRALRYVGNEIHVMDGTAHAAIVALQIDMMMRGSVPVATIVKGY